MASASVESPIPNSTFQILLPLFLAPAVLPELDEPDGLVGAHAPDGAGGVHGSQHNAAAAQQELRRLHVPAPVLGPPGADGIGLVRDLADNLGWDLQGARTLVLGAGGAAQGVIEPLKRAGAVDLTIANRTQSKAESLAARFGVASAGLDEVCGGWDVILNGTAAGLAGIGDLVAPEVVGDARCYDMFYALDGATPFCRWATDRGARAVSDGLGMLVEQAAEAFLLWRCVRPDTGGIATALRSGA